MTDDTDPPGEAREGDDVASAPAPDDRQRAVDALTRLYAEDRLTDVELEERLDVAYAARTMAELGAVLDDLPPPVPIAADALATMGPSAVGARAGPQRVTAFLSRRQRRPDGPVPRRLELRARLGYVELDLTRAALAPGVTEIDARALFGFVRIVLPAGVRVESDGGTFLGFFTLKGDAARETARDAARETARDAASGAGGARPPAAAASAEEAPVIRLTGRAIFGFAEACVRAWT